VLPLATEAPGGVKHQDLRFSGRRSETSKRRHEFLAEWGTGRVTRRREVRQGCSHNGTSSIIWSEVSTGHRHKLRLLTQIEVFYLYHRARCTEDQGAESEQGPDLCVSGRRHDLRPIHRRTSLVDDWRPRSPAKGSNLRRLRKKLSSCSPP
jgi:hypothetical protein